MKNIDTNTGEVLETIPARPMTEKEKNRAAQFDRLLAASAEARAIREMMIREAKSEAQTFFLLSQPLNYFILNFVYAPAEEGTTEFKKFNEWKQEGCTIKKGSKAFPVWSQPTSRDKKKEQDGETASAPAPAMMENANGEDNGEESHSGRERFNMCYLFSNLQVIRREPTAAQPTENETAEPQEEPAEEAAAVMVAAAIVEPEPINIF
jgi:hypothetical protein